MVYSRLSILTCVGQSGGGGMLLRNEGKRVVFPTLGSNLIVAHHLCGMQQERLCARGCCVCGRPIRYLECNAMSYFITLLHVIPRQSKLCISRLGWGASTSVNRWVLAALISHFMCLSGCLLPPSPSLSLTQQTIGSPHWHNEKSFATEQCSPPEAFILQTQIQMEMNYNLIIEMIIPDFLWLTMTHYDWHCRCS